MVTKLLIFILIALFITTTGCWIILTEYSMLNWSLTGVFATVLIMTLINSKGFLNKNFSKHFQKKFASEVISFALIMSILALAGYLITQINFQKDLSKERANTLSKKTIKIISEVTSPLKIEFYTRREFWKNWKPFFNLFKMENNLIDYSYVNIDSEVTKTNSKGIISENTAIFTYKDKKVTAVLTDELSVSNALLKLIGFKSVVFSFLTGHGELSINDNSGNGLSYFKNALEQEGHLTEVLNLNDVNSIDPNKVLVIVDPKNPLLDFEIGRVLDFLKNGGRFIIMQGVSFKEKGYISLNKILKDFNLQIENKMTIDRLATVKGQDPSLPVIESYQSKHSVVNGFKERLFFPLSSSLVTNDNISLIQTDTFPASWAESKLEDVLEGKAKYDDKDTAGPIKLAAVIEKGANRGLVIASHFLVSNQYQNHAPQFNFVLNGVDWIVGQDKMTSLNRPTLKLSRIYLSAFHLDVIFYGTVIIGPVLMLLLSGFTFYRRKSL